MGRSVVVQKEKKFKDVFSKMEDQSSLTEFKNLFKELYPKDWDNIKRVYNKHEKENVKGKGHPMAHPEKYLENMFKVQSKKIQE